MQVPTYPDGRVAVARLGGRALRRHVAGRRAAGGPRRGAGALLVLVVVVLAATVACSTDEARERQANELGGLQLGDPTSTVPPVTLAPATPAVTLPEGFVLPDTRTVSIPPVLGRAQPEIDHSVPRLPIRGGKATLRGTVFGPDGPVEGATVRLERFAGEDFGREDIATRRDGTWEAVDLIGGRYKVRAWVRPDLATVEPQAAFVANENGSATLDITMERHDGEQIQGALEDPEPAVGRVVTFRALVSKVEVDEEGIVRGTGIADRQVQVGVLGGIRVVSEKKPKTDADGFVTFSMVCLVAGVHAVDITSGELSARVELPECLDGVLDNEAVPPDFPEFVVGATFTVPSAGPYPPGTYTATNPGPCGTSYQEFVVDKWATTVNLDRTITVAGPIRNLGPVPSSTPCTFRRTA